MQLHVVLTSIYRVKFLKTQPDAERFDLTSYLGIVASEVIYLLTYNSCIPTQYSMMIDSSMILYLILNIFLLLRVHFCFLDQYISHKYFIPFF